MFRISKFLRRCRLQRRFGRLILQRKIEVLSALLDRVELEVLK